MKSIQEVVFSLEKVVETAKTNNEPHGYFAVLYLQMTKAVQQGIISQQFENGLRMEKLDVIFAGRYLDALEAWKNGKTCTKSWQKAFDAAKADKISVIQHLLCGINAHINLDLAIAAAQTMEGQDIQHLKKDFEMINAIIGGLVDVVQDRMSNLSWPMRFLDHIGKNNDEAIANFSIGVARKASWQNAINLSKLNGNTISYIEKLDSTTELLADGIIKPGFFANLILKPVKWFEKGTVIHKIDKLDGN